MPLNGSSKSTCVAPRGRARAHRLTHDRGACLSLELRHEQASGRERVATGDDVRAVDRRDVRSLEQVDQVVDRAHLAARVVAKVERQRA